MGPTVQSSTIPPAVFPARQREGQDCLSTNYSSSAACRFFSVTFAIFSFTSSPLWHALGPFSPPPLGTAVALPVDIVSMFKRSDADTFERLKVTTFKRLLPYILRVI